MPSPTPGAEQHALGRAPSRHTTAASLLRRALLGIVLLVVFVAGGAWLMHASVDPALSGLDQRAGSDNRKTLAEARTWAYQLAGLDPRAAGAANADVLVIDPDNLKEWRTKQSDSAVAALRRRPDGGRRLVLAYLSIGEAESYRDYWGKGWVQPVGGGEPAGIAATPHDDAARSRNARFAQPGLALKAVQRGPSVGAPAWLGDENPRWRGNYAVRYWDAGWQRLLFGNPASRLDQIMAAGFDGIYLDRADVHAVHAGERSSAENDMVDLITRLARHARQELPEFVVVMQNAEELLAHKRLRDELDGVAKEDLFFGVGQAGVANTPADVNASLHYLAKIKREGKPVFVVEYLEGAAERAQARRRIGEERFIPYFAPRALDRLDSTQ